MTLEELKNMDQEQFTAMMAARLVKDLKDFGL